MERECATCDGNSLVMPSTCMASIAPEEKGAVVTLAPEKWPFS
jgi:hypothetical protein